MTFEERINDIFALAEEKQCAVFFRKGHPDRQSSLWYNGLVVEIDDAITNLSYHIITEGETRLAVADDEELTSPDQILAEGITTDADLYDALANGGLEIIDNNYYALYAVRGDVGEQLFDVYDKDNYLDITKYVLEHIEEIRAEAANIFE